MVTLVFEHREQKDEESTYATLQTSDCTDEVDIRSKKNNRKKTKKKQPPEPNNDFVGNDTPSKGHARPVQS